MDKTLASLRWDTEYKQGRYTAEPPLPFVEQIIDMLQNQRSLFDGTGLYVGCGNGRNYTVWGHR